MEQIQAGNIGILEPIGAAIEKTREILFHPFDVVKWLTIGFCAWLASFGSCGPGFNYQLNKFDNIQDLQNKILHLKDVVLSNLPVILSVGTAVAVIVLAISALLLWLHSRGQFMFLDCVARNSAHVVYPWKEYADQANSLFVFNIVLWLVGLATSAVFLVPTVFLGVVMFIKGFAFVMHLFWIVLLVSGFIFVLMTIGLIKLMTKDFIIPIMYLRRCSALAAWREFKTLLFGYMWPFTLYLSFLFVVGIILFVIVLAAIFATCCCAACILAIPYIGTVMMLPLLVWRRAYSLCYLAQYGSAYDVFGLQQITACNSVNQPTSCSQGPVDE
ncbi:MAG TPA: hypothetical protein P5175_04775 [Anaerohalosphaeraceae bacterium]|nr:hypothetical protein [Anaerohalosphaeraceae bacterium]HOM76913.1 hypothetical protein [Anaerohalosphaeraceae bacterium]HPC63266.1 hypothetical protein [Anaerohalosphaeraceae bacterium]HPO69568.1 hypothetical protein [Anaerohalosphaeraceae bacterium]HRS71148.1 hypothetical protein [Anaerohalosphaeraceae bacterium]